MSYNNRENWTREEWIACLHEQAAKLADLPDRERRHLELIESAEERSGAPRTVLELAYEIAQEEGLDPGLALELIVCRVAVIELTPPGSTDDQAHDVIPEFVAPVGLPDELVQLERRMRLTYRRLRSALERSNDFRAAIDLFASEPDVAEFTYLPVGREPL